jgi:hypothetical protein
MAWSSDVRFAVVITALQESVGRFRGDAPGIRGGLTHAGTLPRKNLENGSTRVGDAICMPAISCASQRGPRRPTAASARRALVDPISSQKNEFPQDPLSNRACDFPAHGLPVVSRAAALRSLPERGIRVPDGPPQAVESDGFEEIASPPGRFASTKVTAFAPNHEALEPPDHVLIDLDELVGCATPQWPADRGPGSRETSGKSRTTVGARSKRGSSRA